LSERGLRARAPILVTGAAGFIGSRLAVRLAEVGWRVTGVDRVAADTEVRGASEFVQSDMCSAELLDRVRRGAFAAVLHHGAISDTLEDDWSALERVNLEKALELAAACHIGGARFVYASSFSVYGRAPAGVPVREDALDQPGMASGPLNPYARSKLGLDRAMQANWRDGLCWIGLRYTNVFGPREWEDGRTASILYKIVRRGALGEEIRLFGDALLAARDYLPVDRVVTAVDLLLRREVPSGVYNLGSGVAVSFAQVLQWCSGLSGRPLHVELVRNPISHRYQYWTCADLSKIAAIVPELQPMDHASLEREVERTVAGVRSATDGVGTAPPAGPGEP
jgi:ADP-L-glycero-D-manno-heptose 6-epimerase